MPTFDERPLNWLLVAVVLLAGWAAVAYLLFFPEKSNRRFMGSIQVRPGVILSLIHI